VAAVAGLGAVGSGNTGGAGTAPEPEAPTLLGRLAGRSAADDVAAASKANAAAASGYGSADDAAAASKASKASGAAASAASPAPAASEDPTDRGNFLGRCLQTLVANFDERLIGLKIVIDSVKLEPMVGRVELHGVTVPNPEGYRSAYLLRADVVLVDLDMQKLLLSVGGKIDVEEVVADGVDVIYEKALTTSNVNELVTHLSKGDKKKAGASKKDAKDGKKGDGPEVKVHRVLVRNIGAKLAAVLTAGYGPWLEVGDTGYEDFDKEAGGARGFMDVVRVLLATLLKSILATVVGKGRTKSMMGAMGRARRSLTGSLRSASSLQHGGSSSSNAAGSSSSMPVIEGAAPQQVCRSLFCC